MSTTTSDTTAGPMMALKLYRVKQEPQGYFTISDKTKPLSRTKVNPLKIAMAKIDVKTIDDAIAWIIHHRKSYLIIRKTREGTTVHWLFFYPAIETLTEKELTSAPLQDGVDECWLYSTWSLIQQASAYSVTYVGSFAVIQHTTNNGIVQMKTYVMAGSLPTGSSWQSFDFDSKSEHPDLACLETCSGQSMPYAAYKSFLKLETSRCWCATNMDTTGLSKPSVDTPADYIWIVYTGDMIEPFRVDVYSGGELESEFLITPQPYGYYQLAFKQPATAPARTLLRSFVTALWDSVMWYTLLEDGIGCAAQCGARGFGYSAQRPASAEHVLGICNCGVPKPGATLPSPSSSSSSPRWQELADRSLWQITWLQARLAQVYKPTEFVAYGRRMTPTFMSFIINGVLRIPRFVSAKSLLDIKGSVMMQRAGEGSGEQRERCPQLCRDIAMPLVCVSDDMCLCAPKTYETDNLRYSDNPTGTTDDGSSVAYTSVYDISEFLQKRSSDAQGITYGMIRLPYGYRIVVVSTSVRAGIRLRTRFSSTKPSGGSWTYFGFLSPEKCLSTCTNKNMFTLSHTVRGITTCYGSLDLDASNWDTLSADFPTTEGSYQLFDKLMCVEGVSTFMTWSDNEGKPIMIVTSTYEANGYCKYSAKPSGSLEAPLVTYFTASLPTTARWYPNRANSKAECVGSCIHMLFDYASVSPHDTGEFCLCGTLLSTATPLGLATTSPANSDSLQVVVCPAKQAQASGTEGDVMHAHMQGWWMKSNLRRFTFNGKVMPVKFVRWADVENADGVNIPISKSYNCEDQCWKLRFPACATSENRCRCLVSNQGLQKEEYTSGTDEVSLVDYSSVMPKPDGKRSIAGGNIPGLYYNRFTFSNEVIPCRFTAQDADGSPPGQPDLWRDLNTTSTALDCVFKCYYAEHGALKYVALKHVMSGEFQCWGSNQTTSAFDKTCLPPKTPGKYQIFDLHLLH